jgi:predicted RecB family nuclease
VKGAEVDNVATARSWVAKTDIVRYVRCRYAFWLVDSGQVRPADAVDPLGTRLIADGVAFQQKLESTAVSIEVPAGGLDELLRQDGLILCKNLPMFENASLRTRGLPDAIETAGGALYPVEVKSHRELTSLDRIELAFYWTLLAPRRTAFPSPEGVVVLRDLGEGKQVRVALTRADFDELHRLIAAVRNARAEGVEPRVCRCHVCSQRAEDIAASTSRRADLTMVFGISSVYAAALAGMGCTRYDQLGGLVPAEVMAGFRERKLFISPKTVVLWQLHARAYAEGMPLLASVREPLPVLRRYVALDLEWDLSGRIWLAGAGVVEDGHVDYMSWWADDPDEEQLALQALAGLLASYPSLPVLTWNGKGADLPQLAKRAAYLGDIAGLLVPLTARHFDLYLWVQKHLRLPMPSLGLKDVSGAFGYSASSGVGSGKEAMMLYEQYREAPDPALKARLTAYNRDDVASLVAVAGRLVELDRAEVPASRALAG